MGLPDPVSDRPGLHDTAPNIRKCHATDHLSISFPKPELKAVSAYYDRLTERAAYRAHGRNGTP